MSEPASASAVVQQRAPAVAGAPSATVVVDPANLSAEQKAQAVAMADATMMKFIGRTAKGKAAGLKPSEAPPAPATAPPAPPPAPPSAPPVAVATEPADLPTDAIDALLCSTTVSAEPPENELETIPLEKVDEKIRPNLAKMRTALEAARKEAKDLSAKVAELSKKATIDPKEVELLKANYKQVSDTLSRVSLENHPEFKSKYDIPRQAVIDNMKPILANYGVDAAKSDTIANLLAQAPASQRMAILQQVVGEELLPTANSVLTPLYVQADQLQKARDQDLANHQATLQAIQANEQETAKATTAAMLGRVKQVAFDQMIAVEPMLQVHTGNDRRNAYVQKLRDGAEALFSSDDPLTHAKAFIAAATLPAYKALADHYRKAYEGLLGTFKERGMATPGVDNRPAGQTTVAAPTKFDANSAMAHLANRVRAGEIP